jgi:DNA-binding response OmpR family regulator
MHIGIAEDDPDQAALLSLWLEGAGHSSKVYGTAADYLDALKRDRFDLLIIDWKLPDDTGAELIDWVRAQLGWELPVLVVTSRDDEETVVAALKAGADDYVVKPPKPMELLARVAALGRRIRAGGMPVLRLGAFEIDIQRQRLALDGEPMVLTQKEFDLSTYLFQNPGKLLSRDHLLSEPVERRDDP